MDEQTFNENFNNQKWPSKTYLCYQVEKLDGDAAIPLDKYKGFVHNEGFNQLQGPHHAEFYFLEQIRSWNLDQNQKYKLTCFISWSPCYTCAGNLTTFLEKNHHIRLHILASRIYTRDCLQHCQSGSPNYLNHLRCHQRGLRALQAAGALITIMRFEDFKRCWETFVDHQGNPFQPWGGLEVKSQKLHKQLQAILQTQQN